MSLGLILLIVVTILIAFGVGQRVLDRLRLTDKQAIFFVLLIFVGGLIPDIPIGDVVRINIGGALVPFGLCVYLLIRAGTAKEVVRTIIAAALTTVAIFYLGRLLPNEPETMPFDVNYIYGLAGGLIAYILGRSRRGAFVAAVLGSIAADVWQSIELHSQGINQTLVLGGAGAVDVIVISGIFAVLLAELIGELIERATRGKRRAHNREFRDGRIVDKEGEKH